MTILRGSPLHLRASRRIATFTQARHCRDFVSIDSTIPCSGPSQKKQAATARLTSLVDARRVIGLTEAGTDKRTARTPSTEVDMATAAGNPWRFRILAVAALGDLSPSGFVAEHGGEISNIARHFRQLASWGYLEQVERKTGGERRGGVEHVYRRVRRTGGAGRSEKVSPRTLQTISEMILGAYLTELRARPESGFLDVDDHPPISCASLELNKECLRELGTWFDDLLARLPALQEKARAQMEVSGEESIDAAVGLSSFPISPDPAGPTDAELRARGGISQDGLAHLSGIHLTSGEIRPTAI